MRLNQYHEKFYGVKRGKTHRLMCLLMLLFMTTISVIAQKTITGIVMAKEDNEPVIGASMTTKGTTNATLTDFDGKYTIKVNQGDVLVCSYVGYNPQEIVINNQTTIDIVLSEDTKILDEVVIVGYGVLKRRNIVGAIESMDGSELENRSSPTVGRSLQGQISGLNIVQVDGKPGHQGQITIRGQNTSFKARKEGGGQYSNNLGQGGGALILIDGAEGDFSSVNPSDIANISVLKDASSAAVYGSRGSHGVILITTKNAEKGKVKVTYNGSVSINRRTVMWEDHVVTDPVQWVEGFRESYLNASPTATVPSLMNNYFPYSDSWFAELKKRKEDSTMDDYNIDENGNYTYYGGTNWLKEFYKRSTFSTNHSLSIQGGGDKSSYYVSARYFNQDGIYKVGEEDFTKMNLRARGTIQIRPWLTFENNASMVNDSQIQPMVHYGQNVVPRQLGYFGYPVANMKNPDGTWTQTAAKTGYAAFSEGTSWQENKGLEFANTATLRAIIIPKVLNLTADFTYKGKRTQRQRMENLYTFYTGTSASGQDYNTSSFEDWRYDTDYMSGNVVATYTPKISETHDLNVVGGWNIEDQKYRTQKAYREGNLYPNLPGFSLMDGEYYSTTSGGNSWGVVGFFSRMNYAYKSRYLLEFSGRYDGASKFPTNSQWGFFPSGSLGWRLSEEQWVRIIDPQYNWLSNFTIRASVGSLGNANVEPYKFLELMGISKTTVLIDGSRIPYTEVPQPIPDDITWETNVTYNLGVDMSFLNDRLNFIGDIYRRNTNDLYTAGPNLPQVFGESAPSGNYAGMKTYGWELNLNWRDSFNVAGKPFSYGVRAMLWDSRSWITDYYNETGDLTTYYEGMRLGEMWGFRTAGLYASNAEALNGPAYNFFKNGEMFQAYAGDLKFVDLDGNGKMTKGARTLYDHGDMEIIGNTTPRYHYSLNLSASWNGVGFSMLWQGVGKRDWYPQTESGFFWGQHNRSYDFLPKVQTGNNIVQIDKSTSNWTVTNMDKNPYWSRRVSLAANRNDGPLTWENTHYLQDASYVRLKNITIDYTFPITICKKIGLESLKVYVSGENLFTGSPMFKYTDLFDPEVITSGDSDFSSSTTGGLSGTGDGYSYPMLKNITFGLNVTF